MKILAFFLKMVKTFVHNYLLSPTLLVPAEFRFPFPLYQSSDQFGQKIPDRGTHLGLDFNTSNGAGVRAAACGVVVATWYEPGTIEQPGFGHVVVIAHRIGEEKFIYTLYGHLGEVKRKKGENVCTSDAIGIVGEPNTPENGHDKDRHLHFAIYDGPFPIFTKSGHSRMLPGYLNEKTEEYTKLEYWEDPLNFIHSYKRRA
jgi:murein DD-endopeptidase MepM/ murein hydrolase activator NlpD